MEVVGVVVGTAVVLAIEGSVALVDADKVISVTEAVGAAVLEVAEVMATPGEVAGEVEAVVTLGEAVADLEVVGEVSNEEEVRDPMDEAEFMRMLTLFIIFSIV